MRKSKFTSEQIAYCLTQAQAGVPITELCRKYGISMNTFYRWKTKFGGLTLLQHTKPELGFHAHRTRELRKVDVEGSSPFARSNRRLQSRARSDTRIRPRTRSRGVRTDPQRVVRRGRSPVIEPGRAVLTS